MKLATYKDGSRDGQLVVVSRDLSLAHFATGTATRLQQALDDWNFISPQLQDLYVALNQGKARHAFAFDPRLCMAPLPRAYQRADGCAYPAHRERLHPARGAGMPDHRPDHRPDPLRSTLRMVQGGSDNFLGPCDDAWFGAEAWGIDFGAELAVITDDVEMGASPEQALDSVRLLMLANTWTLRHLQPAEQDEGFDFVQSKPATAFSPVAVTPDELGDSWRGGRVHGTLQSALNGKKLGLNETGPEMQVHFGQWIAHLAKTRHVRAGAVIGSGTVSNADAAKGFACIAEKRALETLQQGAPQTPLLALGDRIRIEMKGRDGLSLFGAIEQRVTGPQALQPPGEDENAAAGPTEQAQQAGPVGPANQVDPPDDTADA
jgi:fumarylacetoacetate (FAA) hydrolase